MKMGAQFSQMQEDESSLAHTGAYYHILFVVGLVVGSIFVNRYSCAELIDLFIMEIVLLEGCWLPHRCYTSQLFIVSFSELFIFICMLSCKSQYAILHTNSLCFKWSTAHLLLLLV